MGRKPSAALGSFSASSAIVAENCKLYYYVVECARVDGKPRIVHQAYLGTAEKLAEMVRDRTAPVPLAAAMREFGLPAALWSMAQQTGVWDLLHSVWPAPRSGPSPAHYLLLAAVHRVCQPGPKTEVAHCIGNRSSRRYGTSLPSALPRKPFGTPSNRFCPKTNKISLGSKTRWRKLNWLCSACGKKNSC